MKNKYLSLLYITILFFVKQVTVYADDLNIKSSYLLSISKVNAQRMIMNVLKEDLKTKIHALEIKIEQ